MPVGPILVVGKSGQLARCLVDSAAANGVGIETVGRSQLDLEDAGSIQRIVRATRPSAIINAAAYTFVEMAEAEPARAFAINRDGAERLAFEARLENIPLIHISTDYVFDGRKTAPYTEDDEPSPLGVYGQSKLEGEIAVLQASLLAMVLRTSWLYSPYGNNFVKTMLRLGQAQEQLRVIDDQYGAPTSAIDLADAILKLLVPTPGNSGARSGIFHLTAQGHTSWHGFAKEIFANWSRRGHPVPTLIAITTEEYPTSVRRPHNSRLDCGKMERAFGIKLPPWKDSLPTVLEQLDREQLHTN